VPVSSDCYRLQALQGLSWLTTQAVLYSIDWYSTPKEAVYDDTWIYFFMELYCPITGFTFNILDDQENSMTTLLP